jgi:hypothetical protein
MRRRSQRERRMPVRSGLTLLQRVRALSAGRPIWLAFGHITLSGTGDVLSWHDWNDDTHVLTQADTAKQVDPPTADAKFANQPSLRFTGVEAYVSNRASTYWSFCHDSVGTDIWSTFRTTTDASFRFLWSTTTSSNVRGANIYVRSGLEQTEVGNNGASVIPTDATSRIALPAADTAMWGAWGHGTALTPDFRHQRSGGAAVTRNYANAPDAPGTAPTFSFTLGAAAGNVSFVGAIASIVVLPSVSAAGDTLMKQYNQQTYGIAP